MAFIALHLGAGYHSSTKRDSYMSLGKNVCQNVIKMLKEGRSSLEGVVEAIKALEDDELTNAGYGSNMNMQGYVECDASLMDGDTLLFGSVAALRSIKNPIVVAKLILDGQRQQMPLGLVPPSFLAGEGAKNWALSRGCATSTLETSKSSHTYNKNKRRYDQVNDQLMDQGYVKHQRIDTVGAVCVDAHGHIATGVSSGGLILKTEGRVGQASIIGAGCWAEKNVAFTSSGIGEYLMRTSLAKQCAQSLSETLQSDTPLHSDTLSNTFQSHFFSSPLMANIAREDHLAGVLGLIRSDQCGSIELVCGHSTASMCVAYMACNSSTAKAFISELPDHATPGSMVTTQSKLFRF